MHYSIGEPVPMTYPYNEFLDMYTAILMQVFSITDILS